MEKEKHEVHIVLRDWTKANKANSSIIAEKKEVYHDQNRKNYHRNS